MRRARWLAPWKDSTEKPVMYHCLSRVVDRRFVFGELEREKFRVFMRMQEQFSGCRVLTYCVMSNHFHILLEVPPMPASGISDGELLRRLSVLYGEAVVASVAAEFQDAKSTGNAARLEEIRARYTYRMHNLSEFMKALLIRFTRWFNGQHDRSGTLWEERFKSVIVESGTAARTVAAYIDLNPVRAGLVEDAAGYRWSGYGEAVGGGRRGNGKKAREGLVRACMSHHGAGFDAERWNEVSRIYRRALGIKLGSQPSAEATEDGHREREPGMAAMLRHRVRYFTDGAVIGSRAFVDDVFASSRHRFTARRRDGARPMRGTAAAAAGVLWSMRALRLRV
jgi:REP element-mobilizing transposase RayT